MTNRENPIHRIKSYLGSGSGSKSKWYGSETLQTRELSYDFEMLMSTRKPVIRKMCLLLEFRICLFQFWLRTVYIQTKYRRPFSLLNLHIPVLRIRIFEFATFWLPGSGSESAKICVSTDSDPRTKYQPKTTKESFALKS